MKFKRLIFFVLLVGVIVELGLRIFLGFGHQLLQIEDEECEYLVKPNQNGHRFGKLYNYNSYSQRSDEPDSTKKIVLGLGDSVIDGGSLTDQEDIATSLFTKETGIQMLNISNGSWGPDNCAAYLKKFGLFNANAMYLLVSSHDAHDVIDHQKVVGVHPSYPDKDYLLAWNELIFRYIIPRITKEAMRLDPDAKVVKGMIKKDGPFNPGFQQLKEIADSAGIPLLICLHPELSELDAGEYNEQGVEIINWCAQNNIKIIKELDEGVSSDMYRDIIHINEKGQRFECDLMKKYISF